MSFPPIVSITSATTPRPFLKWPGGKARLLDGILPLIPEDLKAYHEVCLGGGAVFFGLRRRGMVCPATVYDLNAELVRCYRAVQQQPNEVIEACNLHAGRHGESYFLKLRQQAPAALTDVELAGRMIYVNRACYNGKYVVRRNGALGVAWGQLSCVSLDAENLLSASAALNGVELIQGDFACILDRARPGAGELVYIDPPYPGGFVQYTPVGFDESDHVRLAEVCRRLHRKGCLFLLSNGDVPFIRWLYRDFQIVPVRALKSIAADPAGRGFVNELLIMNF